ncbi:MAG: AAA family ATPase [Gemmataceae bacterium]|nr:AAA family ATPase [Gemmataceae bacterium]
MPRFVVLEHDWPARHWDFLLEAGEKLRAWRLLAEPAAGAAVPTEPNADHRLMYLDYDGPVSGGRGTVTRWDAGEFAWERDDAGSVAVQLHGAKLAGRAVIESGAFRLEAWHPLVAMAGLPGTGKSTIAARLAAELGGVVMSKDVVRAALFPPAVLDYSREQDDATMFAVLAAARLLRPRCPVVLDGRTFLNAYQVRDLLAPYPDTRVIECVCADDVAKERLKRDLVAGTHPAKNRTFALYLERKATAEPLTIPRLTLDTGTVPLDECVARALAYIRHPSGPEA